MHVCLFNIVMYKYSARGKKPSWHKFYLELQMVLLPESRGKVTWMWVPAIKKYIYIK